MMILQHRFVEFIDEELEEGILYISLTYCTAIHKCVCGCGNKVVTPISPTGWELRFNGDAVSLFPSIGNWNFDCQSHYFIINGEVIYAKKLSKLDISRGRDRHEKITKAYYRKKKLGDANNLN